MSRRTCASACRMALLRTVPSSDSKISPMGTADFSNSDKFSVKYSRSLNGMCGRPNDFKISTGLLPPSSVRFLGARVGFELDAAGLGTGGCVSFMVFYLVLRGRSRSGGRCGCCWPHLGAGRRDDPGNLANGSKTLANFFKTVFEHRTAALFTRQQFYFAVRRVV